MMQFLKDAKGNLSSMRLALLLWAVGSFFVWAGVSITTMTVQPIPSDTTALIGILTAGKAVQKKFELNNKDISNE